jgi:iron(III) transport system substrate-binding protein
LFLRRRPAARFLLALALLPVLAACSSGGTGTSASPGSWAVPSATATASDDASTPAASIGGSLTIYSGRSEALVGPIIEKFETESGVDVQVNYAGTSELAATILEEGDASPADVFFSQDGGALGALAAEGRLGVLPDDILGRVDDRFRSPDGEWVGVSGRARVVAYDSRVLSEADLPDSILDFSDPAWKGRIGWAPTNASLQTFVTALRVLEGEDAARAWLEGIQANEPRVYEGNAQALEGVAAGEVEVAFINHYYLLEAIAERGEDIPVKNYFLPGGDPGSLVNVAGAGILTTAKNPDAAAAFIAFLLSDESQAYFADVTYEYPLVEGVPADERLTPLAEIESPDVDLSDLSDLQGTLELMQEAGVL